MTSPDIHMGSPPPVAPPKSPVKRRSASNTIDSSQSNDSGLSDDSAEKAIAPASSSTQLPPTSAKPISTKPKAAPKSKPARTPSPPPAPVIPLKTIRLTITLGGPSNYEVDVLQLAKASGQRPSTPVLKHVDSSESEGEDDDPEQPPASKADEKADEETVETIVDPGTKKRRRKHANEYYDVSDPFIDDSELAVDERTFFAQTKQQGFYVSSGEVALARDKGASPTKKPKSTKPTLSMSFHLPSHSREPVKDVPIPASEAEDVPSASAPLPDTSERVGAKRKRYITVFENGKKRKVVDTNSFHEDLQNAIEDLKKEIAKENWSQKGKFPPTIKPALAQLALKAIRLNEYDDYFFNLLPQLFPYNKFTMSKLVKRMIFEEHVAILQERVDELLVELRDLAEKGFPKAQEDWQKTYTAWEEQKRKGEEAAPGESSGTRPPTEEREDVTMDGDADKVESLSTRTNSNAPQKKFRMTDRMKEIVWNLVLLSNKCCELENEKNSLEGSTVQVSEQGLRKVLYQKIVASFPEGWMSSGQISRDVSVIKKRIEKEQQDAEG